MNGTQISSLDGQTAMRTKQDRMEVPCGTGFSNDISWGPSLKDTETLWDPHRYPINDYEGLLTADFGEHPMWEDNGELIDMITACLNPKEKAVINFVVFGGMSLTQAGKYLGAEFPRKGQPYPYSKQTVGNIRDRALEKMRTFLEGNNNDDSA